MTAASVWGEKTNDPPAFFALTTWAGLIAVPTPTVSPEIAENSSIRSKTSGVVVVNSNEVIPALCKAYAALLPSAEVLVRIIATIELFSNSSNALMNSLPISER